eukprot:gene3-4254_t
MGTETFNVNDFVIQFHSILEVPEISNSFVTFLKNEHNFENWEFILSVQNVKNLSKKKNQKAINKEFDFIVHNFLAPKSPKELEILPEVKTIFLEKIKKLKKDEWNLEESPLELLEPFEKVIMMEYKSDSFKRYIRTEECLKLLEKHQHNRDVLVPRLTQIFNYKDEDFDKTYFEEKDFQFLSEFQKDHPNWTLISENKKKDYKVYKSKMNYYPNVTFLSPTTLNVKYEINLNCAFQETVIGILTSYHKTTYSSVILDYKFGDYFFLECVLKLPPALQAIMQKRVLRQFYKLDYDPEIKQLSLYMKSATFPNTEYLKTQQILMKQKDKTEKKIKAIPMFSFGCHKITYVNEKTTRYDFTSTYDVNIASASWSIDYTAASLRTTFLDAISKLGNRRHIADYKYEFNELWEGLPVDPFGKLLWDLNIEEQDKQHQAKMEKRKKVFQISNYVVHFSALKKKEINNAYIKFLKEEHNTDSWDFISEYSTLKKLNEKSRFEKENEKIKEIMKTYIEPNSPKDLCLSESERNDLKERVANRIKNYPSFKYFTKIYQDVKLEHQLDSFKRFVKMDSVQEMFSKYQHDIGVMSPVLGVLSMYDEEDFKSTKINSKDLKFAQTITENSSSWDSIRSTEEKKISYSTVNWFSKLSFIKDTVHSFQFEFIFPYGLQQVANGYLNLSKMNTMDPNITKSKFIDYSSKDEMNRECCSIEMEMIWLWGLPMKKRNSYSFIYYPNELVFISKPICDENGEWFSKENEITNYFQYEIISLTSMKGGKTKFDQIIIISSSEKIDWQKTMIERGKTFLPSLKSSIESSKCKIIEMKQKYLELKDEKPKDVLGMMLYNLDIDTLVLEDSELKDEKPKDVLGMMLYNLDIDTLVLEDSGSLESEDSMTETTFIHESTSEVTNSVISDGHSPNPNKKLTNKLSSINNVETIDC